MATIKGKWQFIEVPQIKKISQDVNYTLSPHSYTGTFVAIASTDGYSLDGKYLQGDTRYSMPLYYDYWRGGDGQPPIIDFGTAEQTVTDGFYTWLTANATLVEEEPDPSKTIITYNGNEIASLEEGQSAIFPEGKKATDDVTITFGANGSITYKGVTTEVEKGKTARLLFKGKKFATDIVVSAKAEEEVYGLVGTWVFNETITVPPSTTTEITFKYLDGERISAGIRYVPSVVENTQPAFGTAPYLQYFQVDIDRWKYMYSYGDGAWWPGYELPLRTIVFETAQIVTKEFYEWFTANATKQ